MTLPGPVSELFTLGGYGEWIVFRYVDGSVALSTPFFGGPEFGPDGGAGAAGGSGGPGWIDGYTPNICYRVGGRRSDVQERER